ncbi:MAG TPA: methionine--tRNA ligase [Burkholderiales bacterium]|nr:methionine--tRNA ligase [Burkholderiales bacterium]
MKKYLVTSALPYINGVKHLGNLIGSILPADVYTRYLRQQGEKVLFICGTDEHGTPAEIAAQEANLTTEEYCTKLYNKQKEIFKQFGIKFDYFGRSSSVENKNMTQEIFKKLDENGLINERDTKQIYSIDDKRFLPDRYVIGTCPFCGYEKARGDQCEFCGKLLDTTQLVNPYSSISGSKNLEVRTSKHLFFDLKKMEEKIRQWVNKHKNWSNVTKGIANKWLSEGLTERCISRDLEWGVKIPKANYENKVFYVWFDAPIAYISFTKEWAEKQGNLNNWKSWWNNNENVDYIQFMAKDNVPFHAIFFPAMLLGNNTNMKLVDQIKGFNWLTYDGGKFSTSSKRGVFLDDALTIFPADYWRYFLLSNAPESSDFDFTFDDFVAVINKDLADILGNLVSRVCALAHKYFDSKIPSLDLPNNEDFSKIHQQLSELLNNIDHNVRQLKFREAMKTLRKIWSFGNEYVTVNKPWEYVKNDLPKSSRIIANCFYIIKISAISSSPFIPAIAKEMLSTISCDQDPEITSALKVLDHNTFQSNISIPKKSILIQKIDKNEIDLLKSRFSGN